MMALLDVNKDRNLSVAELQNAVAKLRTFDTNKDGKWSVEELEQAHQKLRGARDDRGAGQRAGQRRGERQGQFPVAGARSLEGLLAETVPLLMIG